MHIIPLFLGVFERDLIVFLLNFFCLLVFSFSLLSPSLVSSHFVVSRHKPLRKFLSKQVLRHHPGKDLGTLPQMVTAPADLCLVLQG